MTLVDFINSLQIKHLLCLLTVVIFQASFIPITARWLIYRNIQGWPINCGELFKCFVISVKVHDYLRISNQQQTRINDEQQFCNKL